MHREHFLAFHTRKYIFPIHNICLGMTIGKEKVACSGPALVNLTYDEAKICEGIKVGYERIRFY